MDLIKINKEDPDFRHPHIYNSKKLGMCNPSESIEIVPGTVLRDASSTIVKGGAPSERIGSAARKMSLQQYKAHKNSQIRIYEEE